MDNNIEPRFLVIGEITRPHGLRGEMRVLPSTDFPERFSLLDRVFVGRENLNDYKVSQVRYHKQMVLLTLDGVSDRNSAESLRGKWIQIPISEALPLEEGEYYLFQLIGVTVVDQDGNTLGKINDVMETGANNVFIVTGEKGELLIPDTKEVVQEIDFMSGIMRIHLLDGLI